MNPGLRFLGKALLFCLPIAILLGLPIMALYQSGEFLPYSVMAVRRTSDANPVLVGTAYSSPMYYLDLQAVIAKKPDVLVIGSSRAQQFRSDFFTKNQSVYTATPIVQDMGQFKQFLDELPASSTPKVIIMGLDQKFFDPNYNALAYGQEDITPLLTQPSLSPLTIMENWMANWFAVYGYYFSGKFPLAYLAHPNHSLIGLAAVTEGSGYRNDGSYDPGARADAPANQAAALANIDYGIDGFEYSNIISETDLQELDSFLAECRSRNVYVIGFMEPLAPDVYKKIQSVSQEYGYLALISPDAGAVFNKYGFAFYNFTNPAAVNVTETDMESDDIHMTERGSLMTFAQMASVNPVLGHYASASTIETKLAATDKQTDVLE